MPDPFTISLIAAGTAAITSWLEKKGVDFVKEKVTGLAKDKATEYVKSQLAQFRENARLHLRQPDQSIPKALRLAYLQATLQVCALQSDELGTNVTSYSYFRSKLPRWKRSYDEPLGILSRADVQWLDGLHQWLRAEIDNARKGKLPPLEITEQDFADLVPFENDIDDEPLRRRLTEHLIAEIERVCPEMPDRFRSLLTEGWDQFNVHEQARRVTWFDCFCVCFQQALAKDPPAREFFQTKLLAGIAHQQQPIDFDQFTDALRKLNEQLAAQDISAYFDGLSAKLDDGFDELLDRLSKVEKNLVGEVRGSTKRIIDTQTEQTESLLDAIRHGAKPAKPLPPPSIAEVRRYLQELMGRTAKLPAYYPQRLQRSGGTLFDEIRQTVQVVKDRARFQQWTEQERRRAMGQFDEARRYSPNKARPEMEGYGEPREREQPPEPPMDWEKAVALYPCAVILGDPGFGKSWLLRYEARRLARQALTQLDTGATLDEIQLPILTRLADVARAAKTGTVTAALAALASRSTQDDALSDSFHAWVVQHLQMGRCAVLLDAWDEVAEASALQDGVLSRAELADKLSHFSAPRILFTSRGAGYTGSPITGAQELELIAFEQNQIEQFVQVWFDGEPDGSARFLALLEDLPPVRGLARIPLMLSLLIRMFTAKPAEDFPQTRCEIYEQCLRGLLQDWKEEKQPGVEIQDADAMLEALSAIAFALPIEQGAFKRSFLWQQIRQWLGELRSGDSCYGKQPETIILRLLQDGILIKVNDERDPDYLFLHRTFHEYLTACALAQRQDWLEQALQKIYDPAWLQALILLGGKLKTREPAERYIDALRNEQCPNTFFNRLRFPLRRRYKDIFFRPFILAVFAAQEARETLSEQTKNKILDETLRLWRDPPDWLDREWFLNALLSWNKRACPALRVLLRDERVDAGVRGEVAHSLAMLQDRESLPDLRALLRDERMDALRGRWVDASARGKVARSLATLQDRESLPDLRALLRDERANEWLRSTVARSLATLQDRESLPDLRALLADKRMMAHPGVAEALVRLQDRESLPDIRALLRDERIDSTARRLVAEALVSLQDRESLPDIRALLRDERMSSTARRLVAKALVSLQDRESLPDLRALLRDERMERDSVAQFLATLQDRESLPDLRALLRDGRVFAPVRGSVAQALATLQDRESLPDIRALLRDERMEASVRGELAQSLATLQDRESLPDLRALLRDERVDAYLRVTVAKALVSLQDRESLPEILTLLRNDRVNAYLRVTVAYALVTLQDREFLPDLRALLRDDRANAWLRVTVALVLATFQDLESLPDILTVLRDWRVYAWLRRAVALVLAMLQNRESLRDLRARLSDERVGLGTRHEALNALWRLAQAEKIPIRFE